ncbi:MAG TPA: hypothetical protein VG900_15975, partial [Hyphomicrobiaceae bacterium]|nr:hypothetical protein [Hyphomicrobiaceae bacterium]
MTKIVKTGFTPSRRAILQGMAAAATLGLPAMKAMAAAVPSSGKLTVTVLDFLEAPLKPVFEAYKAARPGVEVAYEVAPSHDTELIPLMLARALAGKLTDIVFLFDELAALYADAGITADLRPFFESGGPVTASYFAKPFLDQYLM